MQLTTVQLWERIHAAGLASPEECRNWAMEIANSSGTQVLADAAMLAKELVERKRITPFQANVLYRSLPHPITLGTYRITGSLERELGGNWYSAEDLRTATTSSYPTVWLYAISVQQLQTPEFEDWPPSIRYSESVLKVHDDKVDEWIDSGASFKHMFAVSTPLRGEPLQLQIARGPFSLADSFRVVKAIAAGLETIHSAGTVHGRLSSRNIWCDGESIVLRRDPFFPARSPYSNPDVTCLAITVDSVRLSTAAPELAIAGARPTVASDLYALGCLWLELLTGRSAFEIPNGSIAKAAWAEVHAQSKPNMPDNIPWNVAQCIAHLIAKNPLARFDSASAFVSALDAALDPSTSSRQLKREAPIAREVVPPSEAKTIQTVTQATKPEKANSPSVALPKSTESTAVDPVPSVDLIATVESKKQIAAPVNKSTDVIKPVSPEPIKKKKKKKKAAGTSSKINVKKRKRRPVWFLPAVIGISLLVLVLLGAVLSRSGGLITLGSNDSGRGSNDTRKLTDDPNKTNNVSVAPVDPRTNLFEISKDDGRALWVPPQVAKPIGLDMLPIGPEGIVIFSERLWNGSEKSKSIVSWWTSIFPNMISGWPERAVLQDVPISQVTVALYPGKQTGTMQHVTRFKLSEPRSIENVIANFGSFEKQLAKSGTDAAAQHLWINSKSAPGLAIACEGFAGDPSALIQQLTVGPVELMESMAETQGKPGPVRRQMETLLQSVDSRADMALVAAPSFVFDDARDSINEVAPIAMPRLREVIDGSIQAVSISTYIEPQWFVELRMLGNDLQSAKRDATDLSNRLKDLPELIESQLVSAPADTYWRALSVRLPQMLRSLSKYARFGAEDGQIIANAYLPSEAASNLVISGWMALNSNSSTKSAVTSTGKPPVSAMKTAEQILDSPIKVGVEQESLEVVLQLISNEVRDSVLGGVDGFPMSINGSAFQKEGITRNQQIRAFQHSGVPVREILVNLVRRANPVTTVQSATELDQKVVFVVLDDPSTPTKKRLELTTRVWATANKATLPKEFIGE